MSIFDRRPRLRWAVPVAASALIVGGALVGGGGAAADSGLEPRTAAELLVDLQSTTTTALSGTVVATADLGLPALPTGMGSSSDLTALVSGSHTVRLWLDGPERSRIALLGSAEETDIVRNGADAWVWSSADKSVDHYLLPEKDASRLPAPDASVIGVPQTPQEAAELVLGALDETTTVSTSGVDEVAGRPVYELILVPRQTDTLVARVVIALDAQTSVPLRVRVFSTMQTDPAYEVGFTSVDFGTPDSTLFDFTPPPGATVTEHEAPDATMRRDDSINQDGAGEPVVVGTGWSRVVVTEIPADALPGGTMPDDGAQSAAGDAVALLEALPRTSGTWGSGHVLGGTLFSVIITDDGRIAIGAVAPDTLGAALAAS